MKSAYRKKLKIAIIAPPWLSLYPGCYYGIENVVHHLATNLTKLGHRVELFSVAGTKTKVSKLHWYHEDDQYRNIHRPYYEAMSVSISHLLYSLNIIREAGNFDIIHDHNSFIGPATLAYAADLPPILHTLHEPFTDRRKIEIGVPDNRLMFDQFRSIKNLYFNAVSERQKSFAPEGLQPRIMGVIYNGVDLSEYKFSEKKDDYYTIVASMSSEKGQAVAAKACYELGLKLKMAGTIGGSIDSPKEAREALADPKNPAHNDVRFCYFRDQVVPYLVDGQIEYIGKITGERQKMHFAKAKGFLFPIDWEEPFGMAVIDALASGTPVVAYRRGAMPEIIEHGVNGFLASDYSEFKRYIKRISEIDPAECRQSVEDKFSVESMAVSYEDMYRKIIARHKKLISSGQLYRNLKHILPQLPAKSVVRDLTPIPKHRRRPKLNYKTS